VLYKNYIFHSSYDDDGDDDGDDDDDVVAVEMMVGYMMC
jgi:hypothetical protein